MSFIKLFRENGSEYIETKPDMVYGDSHGSVTVIEFIGDTALYVNGQHVATHFEEDALEARSVLFEAADNLKDILECDIWYLKAELDWDSDEADAFLMDWSWDQIAEFAFVGELPEVEV